MSLLLKPDAPVPLQTVHYPDSDGKPMADNTEQYQWIVTIQGGLDAQFALTEDVFVAGDLLWYPVQGNNRIRLAPDVLVAFGRPKGRRGSYRQWEEGGTAPQVVFEVLSPGNRPGEMAAKALFYDQYGVEEYYLYDPDHFVTDGMIRNPDTGHLEPIADMNGWVSPRLGVRFETSENAPLRLFHPDGTPFLTFVEVVQSRDQAQALRDQAEAERDQAQVQRDQAEQEREQAEAERDEATQERDRERLRADRLAERLRALGIEPDETDA